MARDREAADIDACVKRYLGNDLRLDPAARYASFDYCFNWFQGFRERAELPSLLDTQHLQASCMQLGFYLASWGMLRGSTTLHKRSARHLVPVIDTIVTMPNDVWELDLDRYDRSTFDLLRDASGRLRAAIPEGGSDILTTKILLNVFGCVPAFDTQFKKGFGVSTFGRNAIAAISDYYRRHTEAIDNYRVPTVDFDTGNETTRRYTRAKVVDMVFFIAGA